MSAVKPNIRIPRLMVHISGPVGSGKSIAALGLAKHLRALGASVMVNDEELDARTIEKFEQIFSDGDLHPLTLKGVEVEIDTFGTRHPPRIQGLSSDVSNE